LDRGFGVRRLQRDGLAAIEALGNALEGIEFSNTMVVDKPDFAADSPRGIRVRHQSRITIKPVQAVSGQSPRLAEKLMAGKEVVRLAAPLERAVNKEGCHGPG